MAQSQSRWRRYWCGLITWRAGLGLLFLSIGMVLGIGLARWIPSTSPLAEPTSTSSAAKPSQADDFALLQEIRGLIESEYYRREQADRQKLLHGAARGMVQALGDQNSVYEPPVEREVGDSRWTGKYEGIGVFVDQRDGQLIVTSPVEDGPAARAGIRPGDLIVEADGRRLAGLSLLDQTLAIRGPKGTPIRLTVKREGAAEPLSFDVLREEIRLISARARLLEHDLGLVRITQFTEATVDETQTALQSVLAVQPRGLVLDLRSNGGGLLDPAVKVAGLFLGGGPVVLERHADGEEKTHAAPDEPALTTIPMVVLVDRGTASASEVVAAALRDRGRAELIGERTYGKSTVQYIHRLSDGSGLRLTVAQWHTPSGQLIPPTGLTPDLVAATPNPALEEGDPVLEAAKVQLRTVLASQPIASPR